MVLDCVIQKIQMNIQSYILKRENFMLILFVCCLMFHWRTFIAYGRVTIAGKYM